ncbi:MAG: hypothetical protein Hyperionvirus8_27 [Hyperionvirus sp.]|uniref:Uncharacterized protein n=1 Tax=Hyperionvirus sp. TaxID=2487770 RepID=A0A3G5ACE0_9VIRU|nr:MAG: hypothetical protein Hyperionvirus8_27 [Hyperionvirus sp.]
MNQKINVCDMTDRDVENHFRYLQLANCLDEPYVMVRDDLRQAVGYDRGHNGWKYCDEQNNVNLGFDPDEDHANVATLKNKLLQKLKSLYG